MADFTVVQRGTDTSGRPLFATRYMWAWWDRVCDELGFTPTVVQGAFMGRAGGGAAASAGYHDGGGCFDLRIWDRTRAEVDQIIRVTRALGAATWVRDERHGMDPHIHFVLGSDKPLASGAAYQWQQYLAGRDGLAGNGPDYHPRPSPLVLTPPVSKGFTVDKEAAARFDRLEAAVKGIDDKVSELRKKEAGRHKTQIREMRAQGKTADQILEALEADA